MATLQKIRNRAGLLIGTVGIAMLAFVVGDGLRSGESFMRRDADVVLNIDGTKIKYNEYNEDLQQMQQMSGVPTSKASMAMYVNNQLANMLEQEVALKDEAKKIGIEVTKKEFWAFVKGEGVPQSPLAMQFFGPANGNPNFSQMVDNTCERLTPQAIKSAPAEQQEQLALYSQMWKNVTKQIMMSRYQAKLSSLLARSYTVNKLDAKYDGPVPSRQVAFVSVSSTQFNGTVKVSEDEMKKYYDTHIENFRQKYPIAYVSYIYSHVIPSQKDVNDAKALMEKARTVLRENSGNQLDNAIRNFDNKTITEYLSSKELEQGKLDKGILDTLKKVEPGFVNNPIQMNDNYTVVKLIGKKMAPEAIGIMAMQFDSTNYKKADSVMAAIKSGTSFEILAKKFNKNPELAKTDFRLINQQDSTFSGARLAGSPLDSLNSIPVGTPIKIEAMPKQPTIYVACSPKPNVEKYKLAIITIPVHYSTQTLNEKRKELNDILYTNVNDFNKMVAEAKKKGISVAKEEPVNVTTIQLNQIPNSREVVSWALKNEKGQVSEKVMQIENGDYQVIPFIVEKMTDKFMPFNKVKDQIKDYLTMRNRGELYAKSLEAKNLSDLNAYAKVMNTKVDTLVVTNMVTNSHSGQFNGYSMNTPIEKLSKPFAAETEVMVVQPVNQTDKPSGQSIEAQINQTRDAERYRIAQSALQYLQQQLTVKDNRATFY